MTPWAKFQHSLAGHTVRIGRQDHSWIFQFAAGLNIRVESSWRIRNKERILLTDGDDGQQFGLPARIDAEAAANDLLQGLEVQAIDEDGSTADLVIRFTGDLMLEVITNSSGYESWTAYVESELAAVGRNP